MEADVNSVNLVIPLYLWMLLFLVFLVMAFIGLIVYTSRKILPPHGKQVKFLEQQYENGDMNEEEFQHRIKQLKNRSTRR
ncbi:solute carrier organic anion transporter [Planococcus sp. ANT_H30]|uniref:solute carrier organic anion transporter n=1 Tax=Planococcus sp. ANT_H30 TaxID=2597347 RepID=UPI0011ECC885|nr:solute carrier organic anion transporter [Planococcus sp. ANT_H30]KAA0955297.1 solute carrier organic anion transporter [Planococcus sp. ANT_H30]